MENCSESGLYAAGHKPSSDRTCWATDGLTSEYVTAGFLDGAQYREFSEAYGFDVVQSESFPLLRAVTELKMVTWLMQRVGESETIAGEFAKRMQTLRAGGGEPWRPF